MRFQFFGSCLLAIQKASSWSLFAHAHFILGRPVECLSIWPPSCDFGSCHFLSWASSWVIIRLIPLSSVLQSVGAFFRMHFLQASSSSGPAFSRRQCIFAFIASLF